MELRNDLKVDELLLISTDSQNRIGVHRYWGNNIQSASADMYDIWGRNKGDVVYLFRVERIIKASDQPLTFKKYEPVERIALIKENNEWSVENAEID